MWSYFFTSYILGPAIFLLIIALGFILPSLIFAGQVIEEKVDFSAEERDTEKLRIDSRAKFYKEKYRQL